MRKDKKKKDGKTIELTIQSMKGSDEFSFPKTTKIKEVIAEAIARFGLESGDHFELVLSTNTEEPLEPQRTLVSYKIKDGAVLILTATGSGV